MLHYLFSFLLLANLNFLPLQNNGAEFNSVDLLQVNRIPVRQAETLAPVIDAKAGIVMDAHSGIILYEKNPHHPLPMASLTKIMVAVLILDTHDLDEIVTVKDDYYNVEGVKIGLRKGEQMTIRNLLTGLLVRSGGDAALALASYHSGSVDQFIETMNQKGKTLHLLNTQFKNPIGLDEDGHYASVFDLAMLTKYALRYPEFRRIVRLPSAEIFSVNGAISHHFYSTNKLLGSYLNIVGVKTGTTDAAGESVINLARGAQNQEIIAVLLNSPDRFQENKQLIDWSFRNYFW